jgi:hypothetical protein
LREGARPTIVAPSTPVGKPPHHETASLLPSCYDAAQTYPSDLSSPGARFRQAVAEEKPLQVAGADIVVYCCAAYRAMNAAALNVCDAIRTEGTQQSVVPLMPSRAGLYKYLDYHAYEQKLDDLFSKSKPARRS